MNSLFRLAAPNWAQLKDRVRLTALSECGIFATQPESEFDDIVRIAARICQTTTAMIAFADAEHLHFKSSIGANKDLLAQIAERFFISTVQSNYYTWCSDVAEDIGTETADQPGDTINFFAGVPIAAANRQIIGILCVTDKRRLSLSPDTVETLLALGRQTERQLTLRLLISHQTALINERNTEIAIRRQSEMKLASSLSRVSLVNEIGKTARSGAAPAAILDITVKKLGKALSADRCYFVNYDPENNLGSLSPDWFVDGFESIAGTYQMFDFPYNKDDGYLSGQTSVIEDVLAQDASPGAVRSAKMGLRSLLRAPIQQGNQITALCVAMAIPRKWTEDEVTLVETIAAQTRAAVETARHTMHERALLRDVLASVTEGKLILADSEKQLPKRLTVFGGPLLLDKEGGLSLLRELIRSACRVADHTDIRAFDLMTAAGEAGMNAIVHAEKGLATVSLDDQGTIQVRIEDTGAGIAFDELPKATLARGYSTKETLGHGLKMMLETIDCLYLLTGPSGTTVVLEQSRNVPEPLWLTRHHEK